MSDEGLTRRRRLSPPMSFVVKGLATLLILAGALYALEVHLYLGMALYMQQFLGLLLALVLPIVFISFPPYRSQDRTRLPWYDLLMAVLGGVCGLYVALWYPKVADFIQFPSADKYVLGGVAIILVLEASRRLFGPLLPAIAVVFILYAGFANYFPGPLRTRDIPWMRK